MMAFCNKFGSMMGQTSSLTSAAKKGQVSMASMLNTIRCMSSTKFTKLFVGGLSWGIDDQILMEAFSVFGEVKEARVITDIDSGRSRGFGFVKFSSDESARSAIEALDGQELNGRKLCVDLATEKPSVNFGGGGRGGYLRDGGFRSGAGGGKDVF